MKKYGLFGAWWAQKNQYFDIRKTQKKSHNLSHHLVVPPTMEFRMRKILGVLALSFVLVGSFSGSVRADDDDWHPRRGWGRVHHHDHHYQPDHRWRARHHVWDRDDRVVVAGRDWSVRVTSSRPRPVVHVMQPVIQPVMQPMAYAPVYAAPVSATFMDTIGRTCREYQSTVMVNGRPQPAYGTACLESDGAWRVTQ